MFEGNFLTNGIEKLSDVDLTFEGKRKTRARTGKRDEEAIGGIHFKHREVTQLENVVGDLGGALFALAIARMGRRRGRNSFER